jgi:LysM repeat protein
MKIFPKRQHCFAYPNKSPMICVMSFCARIAVPFLFLPFLTQCGSRSAPTTNAVTGPFDSRGNYIEEWADSPEKWYRPKAPAEKPKSIFAKKQPKPEPKPPQIAVVEPRPSPVVTAPKPSPSVSAPKPKPKPVVVKPKPKPKVVKYTVKKGDNLSRIASRHGIGLSALRRANGISGDLIRPGQVLTIPK